MKEFDIVELVDGRQGTIVHEYPDGKIYEIEFKTGKDEYEIETVEKSKVKKIIQQ